MEYVEFGAEQHIVADVFSPQHPGPHPALIVAMGVRTKEQDRPLLREFSDSLARLGYVTLWPRSQAIEDDLITFEEPGMFVEGFLYLSSRPDVQKDQISFVGFSVGSSIALIASADPAIADRVHSLICFGGYYNLLDYLTAVARSQIIVDGKLVPWQANEETIGAARQKLERESASLDMFIQGDVPDHVTAKLSRISPHVYATKWKLKIFILHDEGDTTVPWSESKKLKMAVEGKTPYTYHISKVFEHVQPKQGFDLALGIELLKLYGFLYAVFDFI